MTQRKAISMLGLGVCLAFTASTSQASLLGGLLGTSSGSSQPSETATLDGASQLNDRQAVGLLTASMVGEAIPDALSLELVKFLRDRDTDNTALSREFAQMLVESVMGTVLNGPVIPGGDEWSDLPLAGDGVPSLDDVWNAYGLARTIGFVGVAFASPDLSSFVLPSNIRLVADYIKTDTNVNRSGSEFIPLVTRNVSVGDSFTVETTLDVDTLIATAYEQNFVTDLLVIQAPLATFASVTTTCTRVGPGFLGSRCTNVDISTDAGTRDKVLATNPEYRFAFPLNAGQFATRATAMDLFQTVYDALGSIHTQKDRDSIATSPFAQLPGLESLSSGTGLADLGTQAPAVNFYGVQTNEASMADNLISGLTNPLTDALNLDGVDVRRHAGSQDELPLDLSLSRNGDILLDENTLVDGSLGVTAGYRAEEVRSGEINLMAVRWHNIGLTTLSLLTDQLADQLPLLGSVLANATPDLVSTPATIFYDVPQGQYTLTNDREDSGSAVFLTEWDLSGEPPATTIPPSFVDLANLGGTLEGLLGLLGGDTPELPGIEEPEVPEL